MDLLWGVIGLVFFFGFWIGALIKLLKVEGGVGSFILHFLGCIAVCFLVGFLVMLPAGKGWEALGYLLLALGIDAAIVFIWGLVLFIIASNKKVNEKAIRPSLGSEDLLDDIDL